MQVYINYMLLIPCRSLALVYIKAKNMARSHKKEVTIYDTYHIRDQRLSEHRQTYKEFLASAYWKDYTYKLRQGKKRKDKYNCEHCHSANDLQFHHRSYYWMFTPSQEHVNLTLLCGKCHNEVHAISKQLKCSVLKATSKHKRDIQKPKTNFDLYKQLEYHNREILRIKKLLNT